MSVTTKEPSLWRRTKSSVADRIPYVRWLRTRTAMQEVEIQRLRALLPIMADAPSKPWHALVEEARADVTATASETGFTPLYRSEEQLYWLHIPAWIAAWSEVTSPDRIVDIGAGFGTLAIYAAKLTGSPVTCIDFESTRIAPETAARYDLEIVNGNVEIDDLDFIGRCDAVIMTEVLEHFNFDPRPTMSRIRSLLEPDGRLFLSTPDAASWGQVDDAPESYRDLPLPDPSHPIADRHIYQFTENEVRELLAETGYDVLQFERAPGRWGLHLNVEARA